MSEFVSEKKAGNVRLRLVLQFQQILHLAFQDLAYTISDYEIHVVLGSLPRLIRKEKKNLKIMLLYFGYLLLFLAEWI